MPDEKELDARSQEDMARVICARAQHSGPDNELFKRFGACDYCQRTAEMCFEPPPTISPGTITALP